MIIGLPKMARAAGVRGATAATAVREQTTIVARDRLGVAAVEEGAGKRAALAWDTREEAWVFSEQGRAAQAEVRIMMAVQALVAAASLMEVELEPCVITMQPLDLLCKRVAVQCR